MSSDFEKWWKESGIEFASIFETGAAKKGWNARQPEIDALKAENDRLRKDAERYRWLRLATRTETNVVLNSERSGLKQNGDLDAAIDAAMKDFSTTKKEE